jgi:hypothetical protein
VTEPAHSLAAAVADNTPNLADEDRLLIDWLSNHSVPCPLCGYDLRTLRRAVQNAPSVCG